MSTFYDEMAAVVVELLVEFGTDIQIQRDQSKFDSVQGETYGPKPLKLTLRGAFPKISRGYPHADEVQVGDRLVVVDAAIEPLPTDKIMVDGAPWSISHIDKVSPAGIPLAYFFLARK